MRTETVCYQITCQLDDLYFTTPWDKLKPEQQSVFDDAHTRCDGGGAIGEWCRTCAFCKHFEWRAPLMPCPRGKGKGGDSGG